MILFSFCLTRLTGHRHLRSSTLIHSNPLQRVFFLNERKPRKNTLAKREAERERKFLPKRQGVLELPTDPVHDRKERSFLKDKHVYQKFRKDLPSDPVDKQNRQQYLQHVAKKGNPSIETKIHVRNSRFLKNQDSIAKTAGPHGQGQGYVYGGDGEHKKFQQTLGRGGLARSSSAPVLSTKLAPSAGHPSMAPVWTQNHIVKTSTGLTPQQFVQRAQPRPSKYRKN